MSVSNQLESAAASTYDRFAEIKAFDETKAGVKGLVDSGITKVPRMFHSGNLNLTENSTIDSNFTIPIIDLKDLHSNSILHTEIVEKIRISCEKWGFFQVINHGIPNEVLAEMIRGIRRFHEQDAEIKKQFYSRGPKKKVGYISNVHLYKDEAANWRDTFSYLIAPNPPKPEEIPAVCRDILVEYSKKITALGFTIFELLSEALGLNPSYLKEMDCGEAVFMLGHYYPACPEPELTMGTTKHTDASFVTILLQHHLGGLQVLHDNHWVDVPPIEGALVINIGDLLQLLSNDRFMSVYHRVLSSHAGPRISVASFFVVPVVDGENMGTTKIYGPIKELLSEENQPIYKDVSMKDFLSHHFQRDLMAALHCSPSSSELALSN